MRIRTSGRAPAGAPASASASATDHTPASTPMPARCSAPARSPNPGSPTLTEAKSGRAAAGSRSHRVTRSRRRSTSPPVIHSPVETPTGTPGPARRTASTVAATSSARRDSPPPASRGCTWTASAPAPTAATAAAAASAPVSGTAGWSARLREPLRQTLIRRTTSASSAPGRHPSLRGAQSPATLWIVADGTRAMVLGGGGVTGVGWDDRGAGRPGRGRRSGRPGRRGRGHLGRLGGGRAVDQRRTAGRAVRAATPPGHQRDPGQAGARCSAAVRE